MPEEKKVWIKAGLLLKGEWEDIDAAILQIKQVPGVEVIYVKKSNCPLEILIKNARK